MASFIEREQLTPVAPSIAPADQILGAFNTKQSLFGIGASQVNSTAASYNQMQLTNPQNQQQLDGLLKTSNQNLKTASLKDLSVGDNQKSAMSVFDPINKDQDIMGDHALTMNWQAGRQKAESDRVSSGGKNFNQAALDAINGQQAIYARSDKSAWRSIYNTKEGYNPYYNTQDETQRLAKGFKTDVIEKDQQNGAYITTTKNSSWYKDKWQQYFEANASPQLKAQLATQARADYYRDMLTMPKEAVVQKYTNIRNQLLDKQMDIDLNNIANISASLAMKHDSKDHSDIRSTLLAQSSYLNRQYTAKKAVRDSPLEQADALGDVNSLAVGTRIAEGLGQYQFFDKMGDAFAHKEEKFSLKPDFAYLSLRKLAEQSKEFGIRQSETNRHNRATEGIENTNAQAHMITANASMITAMKKKDADGNDVEDTPNNGPTNIPNGSATAGPPHPDNSVSKGSDPSASEVKGKTILDNLSDVNKQYNSIYDKTWMAVFSPNIGGAMNTMINDPSKQNMTLSEVPDPTRGTDGSGGNSNRIARFLAAAGLLTFDVGGTYSVINNPSAAYSLKLSEVRDKLREAFSDPAMLKAGLEAIKGNDPSLKSYAIASEIEKQKQRIDGEHADIVRQAVPIIRNNLPKYGKLFEADYFSKGKIPTLDDVKKKLADVPLDTVMEDISAGDIPLGPKFSHFVGGTSQDELYRNVAANKVMSTILGTLGNNRTAYNTNVQDFFPKKGDASKDVNWQANTEVLIDGAQQATKGNGGSEINHILNYAKTYPEMVHHIRMRSVDESNDLPQMQIFFKKPTAADVKAGTPPQSGVSIPTTAANDKFKYVPLDDRTTLLNNKALKFSAEYVDGFKSNLSIYNSTGDQTNPQFDINPDFSYKSLDIDAKTGLIKGVITVYRSDEVNNLTQGRPELLSQAISADPSAVYNTLANKLIKNKDAVNEYLKSNGKIKSINDLPEYLKTALQNHTY